VYYALRNIYLTNNRSLADELMYFDSLNRQRRSGMLARYAGEDETLRDATVLLRYADPERVAGALRILLEEPGTQEDLALSLLDCVDESRMQELTGRLTLEFPFLEGFPSALDDISELKKRTPQVGKEPSRITRAWAREQGTQGFCRSYPKGRIYWSSNGGTHACHGEINEYYDNHGGSAGTLGFPRSPEQQAQPWVLSLEGGDKKTEGRYQRFEGPSDYGDEVCAKLDGGLKCGATVYWARGIGAHATAGPIGELYELKDGTGGRLGFPVESEVPVVSKAGVHAVRQRFQGGVIYYREAAGAIAVLYPIAACHNWDSRDEETRLPEGEQEEVAAPAFGTTGYRQRFERRVTVYESRRGVYIVGWGIRTCYDTLGGPGSWLGFPEGEEEVETQRTTEAPKATIQQFEGGAIYYRDKYGSIPVPRTVLESIDEHGLREAMGFPAAKDCGLGANPDDRAYFFDHGIVTVRDGVAEPWLSPGLAAVIRDTATAPPGRERRFE
jgi:LGFP repeat